jgi:hypothetical protein
VGTGTALRLIKVWLADGMVTVKAAPTPVPGLFVNQDPTYPDQWNVTHLATGCAVAKLDDPEAALDIAVKLGPACDWTLPGSAIVAPGLLRQIRRVLRSEGLLPVAGTAVPRDLVAGMEPLS